MSNLTSIHYLAHKPYLSRAFNRIEEGIKLTLPKSAKMNGYDDADLVIIPVVDAFDVDLAQDAILFQLCYDTTSEGLDYWEYVWDKARLVVSYYDLPIPENLKWKFVRMPLGFDPNMFYMPRQPLPFKRYEAVVTGFVDGPGGEVISDVWRAFGNIAHVGEDFKLGPGYNHFVNVPDDKMRELYQQSRYVIALRYVEGFELPIIEGMACGAQPVIFDMECYTHWFGDVAYKIDPEGDIVQQLRDLPDPKEISLDERLQFSWQVVMQDFWRRFKWLK